VLECIENAVAAFLRKKAVELELEHWKSCLERRIEVCWDIAHDITLRPDDRYWMNERRKGFERRLENVKKRLKRVGGL